MPQLFAIDANRIVSIQLSRNSFRSGLCPTSDPDWQCPPAVLHIKDSPNKRLLSLTSKFQRGYSIRISWKSTVSVCGFNCVGSRMRFTKSRIVSSSRRSLVSLFQYIQLVRVSYLWALSITGNQSKREWRFS